MAGARQLTLGQEALASDQEAPTIAYGPPEQYVMARKPPSFPACSGPVLLPSFDHGVGDPVLDDICVLPEHHIVIAEGNYLLLGAPDRLWEIVSFSLKEFSDIFAAPLPPAQRRIPGPPSRTSTSWICPSSCPATWTWPWPASWPGKWATARSWPPRRRASAPTTAQTPSWSRRPALAAPTSSSPATFPGARVWHEKHACTSDKGASTSRCEAHTMSVRAVAGVAAP